MVEGETEKEIAKVQKVVEKKTIPTYVFVIFAIVIVLCIAGGITYKKLSNKKKIESSRPAEIEDTGKKEGDAK